MKSITRIVLSLVLVGCTSGGGEEEFKDPTPPTPPVSQLTEPPAEPPPQVVTNIDPAEPPAQPIPPMIIDIEPTEPPIQPSPPVVTDTDPPTAEIRWVSSEPDNLMGKINTIECFAQDSNAGSRIEVIELLLNDVVMQTKNYAEPCRFDIEGETIIPGTHTLGLRAYDSAGNVSPLITATILVDFTELRKRALQFLRDYNLRHDPLGNTYGGVRRWATIPMIIKLSPVLYQDIPGEYEEERAWIKKYIRGVEYTITQGDVNEVNNFGEDGIIYMQYGDPGAGNGGLAWNRYGTCTVDASIITIREGYQENKTLVIHEILHTIPMGHMTSPTIMSHSTVLRMDQVFAEAMSILYTELQPCDLVPDE